jgi:hypothetical protein
MMRLKMMRGKRPIDRRIRYRLQLEQKTLADTSRARLL